jgi:transcriptional regulator with XRE-family HTH domain
MFSETIGILLQNARRKQNLSRDELARRSGVSTRLVAEMERGQRPNVSLETALTLLNAVGVSLVPKTSTGISGGSRETSNAKSERALRAAWRRQTWSGGHIHLHDEGEAPRPARSKAKRVAAVSRVSKQAYLIASGGRATGKRSSHSRSGR